MGHRQGWAGGQGVRGRGHEEGTKRARRSRVGCVREGMGGGRNIGSWGDSGGGGKCMSGGGYKNKGG